MSIGDVWAMLAALAAVVTVIAALFVWAVKAIVSPLNVTAENMKEMIGKHEDKIGKHEERLDDHECRIVRVETKAGIV